MLKVNLIGIGPGNPELLTGTAQKALAACTILAGDKRMLAAYKASGKKLCPTIKLAELQQLAASADPQRDILGILVSGDVGFYSLAKTITAKLAACEVHRFCGISSLVYFAAAAGLSWEDAYLISMHGRSQNFLQAVHEHKKVFALTGGSNSVQALCRTLCVHGLEQVKVYVGEELSYPDEKISVGTAQELAEKEFAALAVMFILNPQAQIQLVSQVHGLDDGAFLRGEAPMTKQEVRSVSISKLRPGRSDILFDIGAGTGSCTIEMALQAPYGQVYALEQKPEALALLAKNKELFGLDNITIVSGDAAQTLTELPVPDGAFIGGSSGRLGDILDTLYTKNPRCRIVINVIALETLAQVWAYYQQHPAYALDVVQIFAAANKKLGRYNLMMARNPIYILTAELKEK